MMPDLTTKEEGKRSLLRKERKQTWEAASWPLAQVGWKDEITEERLLRGRQALGKVASMGLEITMNLEE